MPIGTVNKPSHPSDADFLAADRSCLEKIVMVNKLLAAGNVLGCR